MGQAGEKTKPQGGKVAKEKQETNKDDLEDHARFTGAEEVTKDELLEIMRDGRDLGYTTLSLVIHVTETAPAPAPTPGPAPAPGAAPVEYRVNAGERQSGRVKLRSYPSSAADGPTVRHNEIVTLEGDVRGETRNGETFIYVRYGNLTGWVEAAYLVRVTG